MSPEELGRRIREFRSRRGMNQTKFAVLIRQSQQSVSSVERGMRPSPAFAKAAEAVLAEKGAGHEKTDDRS